MSASPSLRLLCLCISLGCRSSPPASSFRCALDAVQVTLAVMFMLVMAACITALGFIPVTNGMFADGSSSSGGGGGVGPSPSPGPSPDPSRSGGSSSSGSWNVYAPYPIIHLLNGVVMLGVVGLCMSLLLLCARSCGGEARQAWKQLQLCACACNSTSTGWSCVLSSNHITHARMCFTKHVSNGSCGAM